MIDPDQGEHTQICLHHCWHQSARHPWTAAHAPSALALIAAIIMMASHKRINASRPLSLKWRILCAIGVLCLFGGVLPLFLTHGELNFKSGHGAMGMAWPRCKSNLFISLEVIRSSHLYIFASIIFPYYLEHACIFYVGAQACCLQAISPALHSYRL